MKIVYPAEGAIAAPDGIALVKGAPHPEAAKKHCHVSFLNTMFVSTGGPLGALVLGIPFPRSAATAEGL